MGRLKLMEREYVVTVKAGVDMAQFDAEMVASTGSGAIPNRTVDVVNQRPGNVRNTHYALTEDEVAILKQDSRIIDVAIPPEDDPDIIIEPYGRQTGSFDKTTGNSGANQNWGMRRCIVDANPYSGNSVSGDYTYNLDGTGVDVVIQDSGIQADHPEFNDAAGNSRLQQIDWYSTSSISGTQSANFYTDTNGHGTHVAGTAAGIRYGWAKNANIYSQKINLSGISGGISITNCFDLIRDWHNNKGNNRPTIVNMSWGSGTNFSSINGGVYRGTSWSGTSRQTQYGMVGAWTGLGYRYGVRSASYDADVEQMISAGIHICIAAGNSYQKIDVPGGVDYDNYYSSNKYYHRGGSPYSENAFMVGNLDSSEHSGGLEQKNSSSENGPGVHLYAPGSYIRSAWIAGGGSSYYWDSNYRQRSITGTSMASPQVCGLGACILQLYPDYTPAQLKTKVLGLTTENNIYSTGLDDDYTDSRSIKDGNNKLLFFPYSSEYSLTIT